MFKLRGLGDVTRFYSDKFRNHIYLITEDVIIPCNGVLLAARSPRIEDMLQDTDSIPAVEFSDNMEGFKRLPASSLR